ncbi:MAG: MBL fold metallo-hydrolase [Candidatus Thiodiazotropha lotti]|uniref:Metallo-beta-lactamase domain-containing protein n=1 Tax=Candidatus Thiodiazotropha endoloripes TaxID=1818881 RepID=A0A1E2UL10_9GAMM|nr:MBL fold metallo-hydrolase [Candidatus Thiodiazotropha endoloripes]MCG7898272.1 MBL fold metallo-hydrolase [Candidatus Thiodiazotropha weberae]MCG7992154.1 MBL fold metallo-hydrolase [Candidatus Thiodiazotropha lotti]MCG7903369.1 MBL fold metallo-hydrolase [Candidatus Thiodiazotropha weberae]MCG7915331.1 MBL fold metallo-hydrolase [Candidatus Thiodiazotropha weberae]MCG7998659.1 MBL fold metallo-hydrolase [Candidatus Thiodiazotropha lotti]
MQYKVIPVTPFQQNCTLFWCENTRAAAIIDPGGESQRLMTILEDLELKPQMILLTHGHLDHAGGAVELAERLGVPIQGPHKEDAFWLDNMDQQADMFGFGDGRKCTPDQWLEHGDQVSLGDEKLEVIHCPGHTPGHIIFFHRDSRVAQVGDVLFKGSIGRTDFPRGDHQALLRSIRERLWPLGDDVRFIPGHGPDSTFGEERQTNPFVADGL